MLDKKIKELNERLERLQKSKKPLYIKLTDGLYQLTQDGLILCNKEMTAKDKIQVFDIDKAHFVAFIHESEPHFIQIMTVSQMLDE